MNPDVPVMVRAWLLGQSSITGLLGDLNPGGSIYAAPDLPKLFSPANGPCVQVHSVGGPPPHPEIISTVDEKLQLRCWAGKEQYTIAKSLYLAVQAVMRGACGVDLYPKGFVIRCLELQPGQNISDPDTGYATVLTFFQVMARASSGDGSGLGGGGGGGQDESEATVTRYLLSPAPDGSTTVFTLVPATVPLTANSMVFRNGALQLAGTDYSYAGEQVTFFVAPEEGEELAVYQ